MEAAHTKRYMLNIRSANAQAKGKNAQLSQSIHCSRTLYIEVDIDQANKKTLLLKPHWVVAFWTF